MKLLWLALGLLFPSFSVAAAPGFFQPPATDKSLEYIQIALGFASDSVATISSNSLISALFYTFNHIIFVLGTIIIVYTTLVGTITTAQEGEFLGRQKWHPIVVPVRAALGIFLLLPTLSGYNRIQLFVIWFVTQGVGAADTLWTQVIHYHEQYGSLRTDTRQMTLLQTGPAIHAIFSNNVCMLATNNNSHAMQMLGEPIQVYRWENRLEWGRLTQAGRERALCGSITLPSVPVPRLQENVEQALTSALLGAQVTLMAPAQQALDGSDSTSLGASFFLSASHMLKMTVKKLQPLLDSEEEVYQTAIENGWIHAGNYYFYLVQNGTRSNVLLTFSSHGPDSDQFNTLLSAAVANTILGPSQQAAQDYILKTSLTLASTPPETDSSRSLKLSAFTQNGSWLSYIFGPYMENIVKNISEKLTTGEDDPILSMASFGSTLIVTCEILFGLMLAALFAGSAASLLGYAAVGSAASLIGGFSSVIVMVIISLFYVSGAILSLYVPLIPYLVFTFCSIGWLILVIESLLGASLIGLTFVIPSEDEIGKAGHAIVILLGLFLRPALMIIGFIFSIQVLLIAIKMLNFGFWETLINHTGASQGLGIFGMLAVIATYVGLATTIAHEAFSLIYVLPNKILRWIGSQGDGDENATQQAKQLRSYAETGAGIVKSSLAGAMSTFSKKRSQ